MYYIGVDGGGTKTALTLINDKGEQVASALSGPLNYNFIGIDAAVQNLKDGIEKLGAMDKEIKAIGIGDPSLDDVSENPRTKEFIKTIEKMTGVPTFVRSDAYMTLYGLTRGDESGVLLISGTGVMAVGEDKDKNVHVAAGWGRLTGDEGGGYHIGLSGIRAALKMADGIGAETALLNKALSYFGVSNPRDLAILFCEDGVNVAGFSASVADCADKGDEVAIEILKSTAEILADYATVLIKKCDTRKVGVYGSVLCKNKIVRNEFVKILKERYPDIKIEEPSVLAEVAAALFAKNKIKGDM